ncbi:MAG: methionine biosynthesis protein MetW, partial [Phycisphaerae bacterium]|nr:methionine biosynthesis protein MetW [Phycisphaerae bacterium]
MKYPVRRQPTCIDENTPDGTYYDFTKGPAAGLAVARMIGQITYLSEEAMHEKFGRRLQNDQDYKYAFDQEFSVESYLDYQANVFVDRFDANTYLYVTKAIDYFDPSRQHGSLREAMKKTSCRFLVISFDSDWLFHPNQSQEIVNALVANKKEVTYTNINCSFGHDSFLLETNDQGRMISGFLHETHKRLQSENINPIKIVNTPAAQKNHAGSIFKGARVDHYQIARLIQPNSSVLDLGCGDGSLLELLREKKNVSGLGFTLGQEDLIESAKRGVNVIQYDMHDHLDIFDDQSYDYVVLSHALQVVHKPENILRQLLRIGREVIVSFPNFAYWPARLQLLVKGKAPVFDTLPAPWYDKPNETINYMSLSDFEFFVHDQLKAKLVKRIAIASRTGREVKLFPNLIANEAIFVIRGE